MRKIIKMISILVMVLVLVGCGKRELSLEEIKLDVEKFSDIPMEGNEITKFEIINYNTFCIMRAGCLRIIQVI